MITAHRLAKAFCLTLGITLAPLAHAQSVAQSGPDLFEIEYLAGTDPAAAVVRIDEILTGLQGTPEADPVLVFDLIEMKADILRPLDPGGAADLLLQLALLARTKPELGEDPVALFAEAQDLFEAAGDLDSARVAADEKLAVMLERAYAPEALAAAFEDFARLSDALGDTDMAETARDRAEAVLAPLAFEGKARGSNGADFSSVDVYYATDRALTGDDDPARMYGGGRGELDLGVATVTVPLSHTPGMVESTSIWRLELRPNPSKHVILQSVTRLPEDEFYDRLSGEFTGDTSEAFVFIHGFNVTFEQATRRAAQMAYDMHYPAVPIVYSWPSRGSTLAYVADTAVVRLSGRRLADFLDDLVERSGAQTIHIVAHSMGNRALTDALEILSLRRGMQAGDEPVFGQVLFAAPDVDAGLFARMARTIRPIAQRLTLYASDQDWALVSSRKLHGNAPRAGQGGDVTLADTNIDSIDMSELGEDMLAHSYFADESSALADIVALFWRDAPPDKRCGLEARETGQTGAPTTWLYRKGTCETDEMLDAYSHLRSAGIIDPAGLHRLLASIVTEPTLIDRLEPPLRRLLIP